MKREGTGTHSGQWGSVCAGNKSALKAERERRAKLGFLNLVLELRRVRRLLSLGLGEATVGLKLAQMRKLRLELDWIPDLGWDGNPTPHYSSLTPSTKSVSGASSHSVSIPSPCCSPPPP